MMNYWADESKIHELIQKVRTFQPLWNVDHPRFKSNSSMKDWLYRDISFNLSVPDEEVKRKWHTLRTQFARECAKVKNGEITTWKYFEELKFLIPKDFSASPWLGTYSLVPGTSMHGIIKEENLMDDNTSKSGVDPVDENTTDGKIINLTGDNIIENLSDDSINDNLIDDNINENNRKQRQCNKRKRNDVLCDSVLYNASEALQDLVARLANIPKENIPKSKPADSLQLFGNYIAEELRNMPNQAIANQVQMQIMEIIIRARSGIFPGCPSRNAPRSNPFPSNFHPTNNQHF